MKEPLPYEIHRHVRRNRAAGSEYDPAKDPRAFKEYPRMPRIALPGGTIKMSLSEALKARSSCRELGPAPLTKKMVGVLLQNALGMRDGMRRYPSGGALYPIETYVLAQSIKGIPRGAHHYHPNGHALEHLWDIPEAPGLFVSQAEWANDAPMIIIFSGIWERNHRKYGDFGYLLGTLEAGHMAQNILLAATALNLSTCPLGGFNDSAVSDLLDLDEKEQPVYAIAVGSEA